MNNILFNDILKQLEENKIVSLELTHQQITVQQAITLADALKQNHSLQQLNISHNKIGYRGAQALATALKTNKTLLAIDIHDNNVSEKEYITLRHLWNWRDVRLNNMLEQLKTTSQNQSEINKSEPLYIVKLHDVCEMQPPAAAQSTQLTSSLTSTPSEVLASNTDKSANNTVNNSIENTIHEDTSKQALIKTPAKDAIDELLTAMMQEQKALYERFTHYINPLIALVTKDAKTQQQITNACFDWLTWPYVYRKNDKIHALKDIQQLRRTLHISLSKADETVSTNKRHFNAIHLDFFGFRLFKQRTEKAINNVKQQEQATQSILTAK